MNNNVHKIEISGIRRFFNKVSQVPEAISLTLGQPDFPVPEGVKSAMINAVVENKTTYTSNLGLMELRTAICKYLKGLSIQYSPEEVCVTVGGSQGLFAVFNTLINPGDKVLIPDPAYPAYSSIVKLLGGEECLFPLKADFTIDTEELARLIDKDKPKLLVLSYPSNPTGAVLSKEERDRLHKIIKDNDIYVVSDEIYSAINFSEAYFSVTQFEDIREKVVLVSGFSKMFSMTGLRIGYVCAPAILMKEIVKVHQYSVSCAPSIAQYGAYEGLVNCMKDVEYMKDEFLKRRDYVYKRLKEFGLTVNLPLGAFYIFPSIEKYKMDSEEFCDRLLREAKVAVVPGNAFGPAGNKFVRISYSYSMEELKEALDRFEKWLSQLK